jgi:hypothetical protein
MRELTRSVFGCTWAMSMFGLQQMLDIAGSLTGSTDRATRAMKGFDSVTTVVTGELSETMRSAFDAGNNLQLRFVDLVFRGLSALSPQQCVGMASDGTRSRSQPQASTQTGNTGDPCGQCPPPNPFMRSTFGRCSDVMPDGRMSAPVMGTDAV